MNNYSEWAAAYPEAARALEDMHAATPWTDTPDARGDSEQWAQQQARFDISHQGAMAWRNNVGATPAKCEACGHPRQPVRYGLSNDSPRLNKTIKSSDLILAIPRRITRSMEGETIAQFGAVECKRPDWVYRGTPEERAQQNWLALISRLGGFAAFSTGRVEL